MTDVFIGTGFYMDRATGYVLKFSEKIKQWSASSYEQTLTIPFFNHKHHLTVYQHEQRHAKDYNWVEKHPILSDYSF